MMKKTLTYVVLLLLGVGASAQSHHEVDTSAATYDTVEYHAPKKNPILYFGSPFCEHFAEVRLLFGQEDAGVGLMYSYVPEVWGFNFSGAVSFENLWLSAGAAYRLSKPWSSYDWHLFANAGVRCPDGRFRGLAPTLEAGVRMSAPTGLGRFSYSSGMLGVMTDFSGVYLTLGFSVTLSTFFSFLLLL